MLNIILILATIVVMLIEELESGSSFPLYIFNYAKVS